MTCKNINKKVSGWFIFSLPHRTPPHHSPIFDPHYFLFRLCLSLASLLLLPRFILSARIWGYISCECGCLLAFAFWAVLRKITF